MLTTMEAIEIKGLILKVLSKLDKVDKIDSLERRIIKVEKDISVVKDLYQGISNRFDRELLILEKRSLEHTKRLDGHDSLLTQLIKTRAQ